MQPVFPELQSSRLYHLNLRLTGFYWLLKVPSINQKNASVGVSSSLWVEGRPTAKYNLRFGESAILWPQDLCESSRYFFGRGAFDQRNV